MKLTKISETAGVDAKLICRTIERLIAKKLLLRNILLACTVIVVLGVCLLTNHWYYIWHIPLFSALFFLLTFLAEHQLKQGLEVVRKTSPTAHKMQLICHTQYDLKFMRWAAVFSDPKIGFVVWISGYLRKEQAAILSGSEVQVYASHQPSDPIVIITKTGILVGEREGDELELIY